MFSNKYAALQWRLKKRSDLLTRLERILREINALDREIESIHGSDADTSERVDLEVKTPALHAQT